MNRLMLVLLILLFVIANSFAQNVGIANSDPASRLDISGDLALREGVAISVSPGANSITLPTDKNSVYRLTGATGAFSISGISGGNDGMLLTLINATGQVMTITNGSIQTGTGSDLVGSSTASTVNLIYNATLLKWLVTSGEGFTNSNSGWNLTGNSGTIVGTNFIGTTDGHPLEIKVNNQKSGYIDYSGSIANTSLGYKSLAAVTSGFSNVAIGYQALQADTSGGSNMAVGFSALVSNTSGSGNVAVGNNSLKFNTTGSYNVGVGNGAANDNGTGNYNISIGYLSMNKNGSGSNNTAVGIGAGYNILGSGNVMLGFQAGYNETSSNKLYISNNNTSTPLIYGDFNNNHLTVNDSLTSQYIQMTNGAANGYVLQSDASGNGSWVRPSSISANNIYNSDGTLTGNRTVTMASNTLGFTGGYVGFGTASPNCNITVGSPLSTTSMAPIVDINVSGSRPFFLGQTISNTGVMIGYSGNDIQGRSGPTFAANDNLTLNQYGGNVGVGTSTPPAELSVLGIGSAASIPNTTSTGVFRIGVNAGEGIDFGKASVGPYAAWMQVGYNGGTDPLVIQPLGGNVGIGNISPGATLDVTGKTRTVNFQMTSGATANYILQSDASGNGAWVNAQTAANAWGLTGNSGTTVGTNFIGTTDAQPLQIEVDNTKAGYIDYNSSIANTGYGYQTLSANTTGAYNTALGYQASAQNTSGQGNVAIGNQALYSNTQTSGMVAIGDSALYAGQNGNTASGTIAIGYRALAASATGRTNTAVGYLTLTQDIGGQANTALGYKALSSQAFSSPTVSGNTAIGVLALLNNTTGTYNTALGIDAGYSNTSGNWNTCIGAGAYGAKTGNNNTIIGFESGFALDAASNNTALGTSALGRDDEGASNVAIGCSSLSAANSINAANNSAVGTNAMRNNTTGLGNTSLGISSLATNTTGNHNTAIGDSADVASGTLVNATAIGYNAIVGASNSLVLGGTGANAVNVGIGTTTPDTTLQVVGKTQTTYFEMTNGATNGYILQSDASGNGTWVSPSASLVVAGSGLSYTGTTLNSDWTTSGSNIYNNNTGNVGIGISSPTYTLDVNGQGRFTASGGGSGSAVIANGSTPAIAWDVNGQSADQKWWDMWASGTSLYGRAVNDANTANAAWLQVKRTSGYNIASVNFPNGNIGIGTTTPDTTLQVVGKTQTTYFQMTNGANANYILQSDASGNGIWSNPNTSQWGLTGNSGTTTGNFLGTTDNNPLYLKTNNNQVAYFPSANNGNLLIGINSDNGGNGNYNITLGNQTLASNVTGGSNIAIGYFALNKSTGANNNIGIGTSAMQYLSTGGYNIGIGYNTLTNIKTGNSNTALGNYALTNDTAGNYNVAIGSGALQNAVTASSNTAVGTGAGFSALGTNNLFLGYQAGYNETSSNKLYIANSNTITPLLYGDFTNKHLTINDSLSAKYIQMTNGATNGYMLQSDASGNGTWVNPNSITTATTVSNTSSANTLRTTVNGVNGSTVPIINTNVLTISNDSLTATVNGLASNKISLAASNWSLTGNSGTSTGTNFIGTTDGQPLEFKVNSTKAGFIDYSVSIANTGLGYQTLNANTSGYNNAAFGYQALAKNTTGAGNIAIGSQALYNSTGNNGMIAIGDSALWTGQIGLDSPGTIAIGYKALASTSSGHHNTAVGYEALSVDVAGASSTAFGYKALSSQSFSTQTFADNTAIGDYALSRNISGVDNTALGNTAGYGNTTGSSNTYVGSHTNGGASGSYNTLIGSYSSYGLDSGSNNTAAGYQALYNTAEGNSNTAFGDSALFTNASGSYNTAIGYKADVSASNLTNATAVGYKAVVGASNSLVLGGTGANAVNVGIGITSPSSTLQVSGTTSTTNFQMTNGGTAGYILKSDASGNGSWVSPSTIGISNALSLSTNTLTSTVNGIVATSNAVSGVSNTSNANTISTTVNGVTGSTVPIINTNSSTWTQSGGLSEAVNGVSSNITPASGTITNVLGYSSSGVPVYQAISSLTGNVSNTVSGNTISTTVDGTTGTAVTVPNIYTADGTLAGNRIVTMAADNLTFSSTTGNLIFSPTSTGKVGIGTASPVQTLSIVNSTGLYSNSENGSNGLGILTGTNASGTQGSQDYILYMGADKTNDLSYIQSVKYGVTEAPLVLNVRGGNVGIGTSAPTQATLVVSGSQNGTTLSYGYLNSSASIGTSSNQTPPLSIYASQRIAATEFDAYSDARIKHVTGRSDNASDLSTLLGLQITNYQFVDTVAKGNKEYKKVIAQEVEKIYPNAVSKLTDVVPDIYQLAEIKNGRITLANTLQKGDRVKLIMTDKTETVDVIEADTAGFNVNVNDEGKIFVFGREVKDFRAVDYEALTTLNISATQALAVKVKCLESENEQLNCKVSELQLSADTKNNSKEIDYLKNEIEALKSFIYKTAATK